MNENYDQIIEKLKSSPELLKNIRNKDDAVKLIAKETHLPEAECAKIYDALATKLKTSAAESLADKFGVKLPF